MSKLRATAIFLMLCGTAAAFAQQSDEALNVTATRNRRPSLEVPAPIDRVYGDSRWVSSK